MYTTIRITKTCRDHLKKAAKKSETYDDAICRILKEAGYAIEVHTENK